MKTVKNIVIKNKKIILRAGLNVPLDEKTGKILDDSRLKSSAKTINFIMEKRPKILLVIAHLGRPNGKIVPKLSLERLVVPLEKIFKRRVIFVHKLERLQAIIQAGVFDIDAVYLLENLRFWKSEEENLENFGREVGKMFQIYAQK